MLPDYAALHPGYNTQAARSRLAIEASRANASRWAVMAVIVG
jgi:hypothetical protein